MKTCDKSGWKFIRLCLALVVPLLMLACAAPPPASRSMALPFEAGVDAAVDDLFAQTQTMPSFLATLSAKLSHNTVMMDALIDAVTGQQTVTTQKAELRVEQRVSSQFAKFIVLPFQADNVLKSDYLLGGTLQKENAGQGGAYTLSLALIELKTRQVVAQATTHILDQGIDMTPTPYYRDSPVLVRDQIVDGYIKTAQSVPGSAADVRYLERLSSSALLKEAIAAYNTERYSDALALYQAAVARPDGQQMRLLNGIYLANWQLGRMADAEQAFGKVVSFGLSSNSLGVKFLFSPGSTDFWADPKVSSPYAFWLRQIARQTLAMGSCINIVGHTSKTGSEQYNNRLSLQRAAFIKARLEAEAPDLRQRLHESGIGFNENIVGTGSDDVRDSLDRRVEFKVTPCTH